MKVTKIDIKKEFHDMRPQQRVEFIEIDDGYMNHVWEAGKAPDVDLMHAHRKFYQWEKVHNPFDKDEPLKHYLVKVDDLGIFKELIEVSNSILKSKIIQAREDGFHAGEQVGIMECKAKIKKLPWWKRLFNKF